MSGQTVTSPATTPKRRDLVTVQGLVSERQSATGTFADCEIVIDGTIDIDLRSHLWFDPSSNTLRLFFPASLLHDDGIFNYALHSAFGGSFGANERAPDTGTFTSTTNALMPFNGILWCPPGDDHDGDGVPDSADECPNSIRSPTVILGGCDSSVPNHVLPNGCTVMDLISSCSTVSRSHGRFVTCVAEVTGELEAAGSLTREQKRAIDRCAARSDIGKARRR